MPGKIAPSLVPTALGFMLCLSMCRPKDEGGASAAEERSHDRRTKRSAVNETPHLSEFQKKRIRSTVESTSRDKTNGKESAIQAFQELLQAYTSDPLFLHELAMETSKASTETQTAFASAMVRLYLAGEVPNLGAALDAMRTDGVKAGIIVSLFADELYDQKDGAVRAFRELLANPSKTVQPDHYERIAIGAAKAMGYTEALAQIPNIADGWFGTAAANKIIATWTLSDPVVASSYVRDMPQSDFRNNLIVNMVEGIALSEDFEMASAWAGYLQGEARQKALDIVAREEAIIRRRNEDRTRRAAQEAHAEK